MGRIILGDMLKVLGSELVPPNSVDLIVTSPPYNVGKEYEKKLTFEEYRDFIAKAMERMYTVLKEGGRICINVSNLWKRPYVAVNRLIWDVAENVGFYPMAEIIWDKGAKVVRHSIAWGSWLSAKAPIVREQHEYILVMAKGTPKRPDAGESTISKDEFIEFTKSVWYINPVGSRAKKLGHPAPFPEKLPYRCIQLFSYKGDLVLDPFAGSGTTCLVAGRLGRRWICIDKEEKYVSAMTERLRKAGLEFEVVNASNLG